MRRKLCNLQAASRNCSANLITIRLALRRPLQIKQPPIPAGNLHALVTQLRRPTSHALQTVERRHIPRELRQKYRRSFNRSHRHLNSPALTRFRQETLLYSFSISKEISGRAASLSPPDKDGQSSPVDFALS